MMRDDEGLMRLQMESEAPGLNQRPPIGANHLMIISSHTIRQSTPYDNPSQSIT